MADVTGTITTIDAILKDNQTAKNVTKQFIRSGAIYDKLSKGMGGFWSDTAAGRRYLQPIETEPMTAYSRFVSAPSGSTYSGEYAASTTRGPAGEKQRLLATYNPLSYISASLRFDLNVIARAGGTGGSEAFVAEVADRVAGVTEAISAQVSGQIHNATGNGTLGDASALIVDVGATGILTVNAAFVEKIIKRNILVVGSKVQLWPASSGVPTTGAAYYGSGAPLVVSAISADGLTITLLTEAGAAPTVVAETTDGAVAIGIYGNRTWNGSANATTEITSIPMIVDSTGATSVGGLTVTNSSRWKGNRVSQGGAFTVAKYMELLEQIDANGGVGSNTYCFADRKRFNSALMALTTNLVGTSGTTGTINYGSTSQVEAGFRQEIPLQDGTTLVQERQCAPGVINVIDCDHMQLLDIDGEKIRWIGTTGGSGGPDSGSILLWDGNFGYYGSAFFNGDVVIDKRNCHGQLYGIS